ncbi:MAG: chemotaxis protein CheW [Opitutaceae bacterium]|nr:chemotaxis protein CheW [Opitutaceae bacterium]
MDDITKEFLVESHENLDRLDRDLVALEKDPQSKETISSIFRTIHTLKGTSGFLGFTKLESVAHVGENLLSKVRDGVFVINPAITSALLATVDAVRFMLGQIEATGQPGDRDYSELVDLLARLGAGESGPASSTAPAHVSAAVAPVADPAPVVAPPSFAAPAPAPLVVATPPPASSPAPVVLPVPAAAPALAPESAEHKSPAVSDSTIRVDVVLLDKLMNLVGELVLARNQVLQFTTQCGDSAFLATSQRLNLITTELQESVMKTRMQPIGNVWSKLPRVVRDLAASCGKQVRIEMEGKETELDKTIIEAIKDPLTHIVRNSVDHGIEGPEAREQKGKPAEGCLKMRAYHEGGQVNIEITDDGGGIHTERVKKKAVERGLITSEQAARMSDHEAINLIFLPGFSTAEKVTNVSGRGVGMDVVKTNIEKIGGTVDLQSQFDHGTTLKIKIPLTLAIIPALIVTSGGDRFAIPQVSLLELVRLEAEQAHKQIEFVHGAPVYRLRGQLLPLAYLNRELKLGDRPGAADEAVNIVVLQADGHPFGLVVDEINDTEEIVVKPLGKQLKSLTAFAGATIMGDGRVALILDVLGLAQGAGVVKEVRNRGAKDAGPVNRRVLDTRQTLLLFEAGQGSRMAIPLSMVARLEEFPRSAIEYSGEQEVVQYRGQILPLIRVSDHVPAVSDVAKDRSGPMQVVVYNDHGRSVGLVVGRISDIVHAAVTGKRHAHRDGIFGSVVIQGVVTDLLDVQAIVRAAEPELAPKAA